ncbi:50S ribosomal protein L22 [bacterium (candidate division B38) B3_B38]|nr:MAG: 50S ribosomal protein L22 [bacterium (candidate division B38) B3_B38]
MVSRAIGRYIRVSPRKARLVINQIRGKDVAGALSFLRFCPKGAALEVDKVLRSAIANANLKEEKVDVDKLYISKAYVNQGPSMKRIRPRAMGRAFRILKRTSHIAIFLSEREG